MHCVRMALVVVAAIQDARRCKVSDCASSGAVARHNAGQLHCYGDNVKNHVELRNPSCATYDSRNTRYLEELS